MQLEESFYELDRVKLKRWFPWLALFRAFRLAIHPRSILLGCLAILLLDAGFALLAQLPFAEAWVEFERPRRSDWIAGTPTDSLSLSWDKVYVAPLTTIRDAFEHAWLVLYPVSSHVPFAFHLFRTGGGPTAAATSITGLLVCLIVWGLIGVGIARVAVVRFAAEQPVRLRDAISFSVRKLTASLGTVILPMTAVLFLWLTGVVLGWMGHIPLVGGVIVGLGWGLAMLAGLAMALILLGLAVGWPLMLASVATEDADAFDAFGRTYNYVFARPWYLLFLAILLVLYGSVLTVFTSTLLTATDTLTSWSVGSGIANLETGFAARAIQVWRNIAGLVLQGFIVSYFWSATLLVYLLLRKCEDGTPLETVTLAESTPPGDQELPLVGMPAAERRERESRPDDGGTDAPSD